MWAELGWRESEAPPRKRLPHRCVQTQPQKGGWTECGQDYQLHMSYDQGKSHQQVGLDLFMIWAENIAFLKEEEVT